MPTIFQIRRGRTFWGVKAASPPPVFRIVVYKHVVWDSQHVAIHIDCCWYNNLEEKTKPHISKILQIFPESGLVRQNNILSLFCFYLNRVNDISEYIFVYVVTTGDF